MLGRRDSSGGQVWTQPGPLQSPSAAPDDHGGDIPRPPRRACHGKRTAVKSTAGVGPYSMARHEELTRYCVWGIPPDGLVIVVDVKWIGNAAVGKTKVPSTKSGQDR